MSADRDDRLDHDDLSDAERAAIEDENDTGTAAAAQTVAEAPPAAQTPPAPEQDTSANELREAAHALTAAAQAMQAQARPAEPAQQQAEAPAPRNFEAELAALNVQYDDGELDVKDLIAKRDQIRDAQIEQRLMHQRVEQQQAQAQAAFASAYTEFFGGAESIINARLGTDAIKPGFDALTVQLIQQGHAYKDALVEARKQVFEQIGIPLPTSTNAQQAIADATAARAPKDRPGPTLADMPAAASLATGATAELDNLPIEQLEARIAAMNPQALEEYLASSEGGLRDNPRGGRD